MARGFGLRARLIGGRGGGDLPLWMNLGQQLAQAIGPEDPNIAQARQLQQAKMQEIQTRTEAQRAALQADAEDQAQYNQLAERMFPSGGRTVTETGPPQVETEPGDIPVGNQLTERNQPLTDNDLLMKQLVRSRNQKILQNIALQQQSPAGPPSVFDIGGGHQVIQQPSGNYAFVPREPQPREQEEIRNVYAMSQYHAPFNQLQPDQQMDILKTIESHKGETAVAQAVNRQTALMPGMLAAAGAKRGEQPAPPRVYLDQTGQEQHPGTVDEARGLTALPISSPAAKTHTASNMVYNHLALGIDNLNGIAGGDRNRLIQNLDNKISVFKNDPAAVALFHFLGPATAVALSNAYAANSAGMRGGARLAMIMRSAGIEEGDTLRTAIQSKLLPLATLNLANVRDAGLPTQKYEEQIKALNGILQAKPGVTLGGQTYRRQ